MAQSLRLRPRRRDGGALNERHKYFALGFIAGFIAAVLVVVSLAILNMI